MFAPAYLDYNATTPCDARVREAMLPWLEGPANASSRHEYGRRARAAIDHAREQVAHAVGAHPTEIVFVSGGSEANNLFIKGAAATLKPGLVAVGATEHPCVREPARALSGWQCREIAVREDGVIDADDWSRVIADRPRLMSVMLANNETGVVQDVASLAREARAVGAWFHTDAVQALGKIAIDFRALNEAGVSAMTLSSHKIHGPLGAGALIADKRVELRPLIAGGGQERGLRSGTENVAAIVGFGLAAELAAESLAIESAHQRALRARLEAALMLEGYPIFGAGAPRLPNTTFFAVPGIDGETLVGKLDRAGFALAAGSACSSASPEPSHVLLAMGVEPGLARAALRVSLGRGSREEDIDGFLDALAKTVEACTTLAAVAAA